MDNIIYKKLDIANNLTEETKNKITNFLTNHMQQYSDSVESVMLCLDYVSDPSRGGEIYLSEHNSNIVGAVVTNYTHMKGYIPANLLVYVATHNQYRRKGIAKKLMQMALQNCKNGATLHVEMNNPAKILYEKLGFVQKYVEMRLAR